VLSLVHLVSVIIHFPYSKDYYAFLDEDEDNKRRKK